MSVDGVGGRRPQIVTGVVGGSGIASTGEVVPVAPCPKCSLLGRACNCNQTVQSRMDQDQNKISKGGQKSQQQLPETQPKQATGGGAHAGGTSDGGKGHKGNIDTWHCPKCKTFHTTSLAAQTAHRVLELRRTFDQFKAWTHTLPFRVPIVADVEKALLKAEAALKLVGGSQNFQKLQSLAEKINTFENQFTDLQKWRDKIDDAPSKLKNLLGKKGVKMIKSATLPTWAQPFIKAWEVGSVAGEVAGETKVLFDEAAILASRFAWTLEKLSAL